MGSNPEKSRIRNEKIRERKNLSPEDWSRRSLAIVDKMVSMDVIRKSRMLHVTYPINNEVDIRPFIRWLWSRGKRVVMPRADFREGALHNYLVQSFSELEPTRFNLYEPKETNTPHDGELDIIIVPGVAYDVQLNRLGYGGGFYDRFLKDQKACLIAPAFDFQIVPILPVEPHDRAVDLIVTEMSQYKLSS